MLPNGKKVLVSGGCGGIGIPLVDLLVADDAEVTIVGRQTRAPVNEYSYVQADLTNRSEIVQVASMVAQLQPDILINLAGINSLTRFRSQSVESIDQMHAVNLLAPMLLSQAAIAAMEVRGSGQIVNIGSVLGAIGAPLMASYCASKAGLKMFSESLRRELAGTGVSVTHINPRAVKTAMNAGPISRFNQLTGTTEDQPDRVARAIYMAMLNDLKEVSIGYPERFYMKLNAMAPVFVDDALIARRYLGERLLDSVEHRDTTPVTAGAAK